MPWRNSANRFVPATGGSQGQAIRLFEGAPPFEIVEHLTVQAMKKAGIEPALRRCETIDYRFWSVGNALRGVLSGA
jgi:hypothetical protein